MGNVDVTKRWRHEGWAIHNDVAWWRAIVTMLGLLTVLGACKRASPTAVSVPGSGSAPATARCVPVHFAAIVECKTEGMCIGVYAVDSACVATMRNEISLGAAVPRIVDLAWPRGDGPLYVVAERATKPVWAWSRIDAPHSANAAMVASLVWHDETFAVKAADGMGFGVFTDGSDVVLTGCAQWANDNEEEWHCDREVYWSIIDKRVVSALPLPAFATPWRAGKLGDNIDVHNGAEATAPVQCRVGGVVTAAPSFATPSAVTMLAHNDYWLWYAVGASRSSPMIDWDVRAQRGCGRHPELAGQSALGPHGYWAHRSNPYSRDDAAKWTIRQREIATPLFGQDGKPMLIESDLLVWATAE